MSNYTIIGIDPGSNTGVSIYTLDANTNAIVNIETSLYVLGNYCEENTLFNRVNILNKICNSLYDNYMPVAVGMETAFLNSRFPKAVMQLSQYIAITEYSFYTKHPFIKIYNYPPKLIKMCIGAGGNAKKDDMTLAVKNIPEIANNINIDSLSEHEIDALAIGYLLIKDIRTFPHILYTF